MKNNQNTTIKTTSFSTLLALAFIILKLCKVITWSWIWVLAPIWIGWGIAIILLIICLIVYGINNKEDE